MNTLTSPSNKRIGVLLNGCSPIQRIRSRCWIELWSDKGWTRPNRHKHPPSLLDPTSILYKLVSVSTFNYFFPPKLEIMQIPSSHIHCFNPFKNPLILMHFLNYSGYYKSSYIIGSNLYSPVWPSLQFSSRDISMEGSFPNCLIVRLILGVR